MIEQPQPPPNSPEIEAAVLQVLIQYPSMMDGVDEVLDVDSFYGMSNQIIFSALHAIYSSGENSGFVPLIQKLVETGQSRSVQKLALDYKNSISSEFELTSNANTLASLWVRRRLLKGAMMIQAAVERREDMGVLTKYANSMSDVVLMQNRKVDNIKFSDSLAEMNRRISEPPVAGYSGVDTGVKALNDYTMGWQSSDVIIIAARPGVGKTSCAAHHAYHSALSGVPTAFITLEIPMWKMSSRIVSNVTDIAYSDITKNYLTQRELGRIAEASKAIENLPLYFYDYSKSWDVADISSTMRSWKRKYGIGMIFVDYIQQVKDKTVPNDPTKRVTSVSEKMKELQSHLDIPMMWMVQLNRLMDSRGDKTPGLADLKHSGQLEQDASTIIFIDRPDYYDALKATEDGSPFTPSREIRYIFGKHREGEVGVLGMRCKIECNRIYEPL